MRIGYILGVFLGVVLVPIFVLGWLSFGKPPVAVADSPFPLEKQIVGIPLNKRINRELVESAPIPPSETNLISGAQVYRKHCAVCHGAPGEASEIGAKMYPDAPPLWEQHHGSGTVGVSDDAPGETYWKVANGIRLTGMPTFKGILSETEMWQVSQLLANANKPLPPVAIQILRGEQH